MATLSLCIIARDEELNLPVCLNSVRSVVDEMVVVDTGSTDRTPEIARQLGARVYSFEWIDDFAAAKNFALDQATGDWILFLDADEVVAPETLPNLRPLLDLPSDLPRCYRLIRRDLFDEKNRRVVCQVPVDRLFPRHPRIRFIRPLHEALVHLDGPDHLEIVLTDRVILNHFGYTERGRRSPAKSHRHDQEVLERLIQAEPNEGAWYYYLGRELLAQGQTERALPLLQDAIRRADRDRDGQWLSDAYSRAIGGYFSLQQYDAAIAIGREAVQFFDESPLWCNLGVALAARGDDHLAIACFENAMRGQDRLSIVPTDTSSQTWRPLLNLATLYERRGQPGRAFDALFRAQRYLPGDEDLAHRTVQLLRQAAAQPAGADPIDQVSPGSRVVFFVGPSLEPWNPLNLEQGGSGIGGSETAVIQMARELRKLGYLVEVYNDPGEPGLYDGVDYRPWRSFDPRLPCQLFVGVRLPSIWDVPINAPVKWHWMHDTHVGPGLTAERVQRIDHVLALTFWHKLCLQQHYPYIADEKILITRNGLDLSRFPAPESDSSDPDQGHLRHRLIYSSAPNRGLDRILQLWPRLRSIWPDAELHVFYGWKTYDATMEAESTERPKMEALKARILALLDQPGVTYHGRVDQRELARQFARSEIWFYPTDWTETFCITALEAQAAGCIPVTNSLAALPEVVRGGIVVPHGSPDEVYLEALRLTDDPKLRADLRQTGRQFAAQFSWASVAREWHLRLASLRQSSLVGAVRR